MKTERFFIICFVFLIITTCFAHLSSASEKVGSQKIDANQDNASSDRVSTQSIACNWEGWRTSYPGVKCTRWPCDRHIQVLSFKCVDGFVVEVKADRICLYCMESPGL